MASSSPSTGTLAQLAKPEYRNWLALGHALTTELRHGLQSFIKRETETFYKNVTTSLAHVAPCTCGFVAKRRPNQYHDMVKCDWAKYLQAHHDKFQPNWKQSDSSKWLDPALGPWEMAKLYLPDLGGHAVTSAEDMDITRMLNLIFWCKHFAVPSHLVKDVREIRNKMWAHVTSLELSDAHKQIAFDAIENLLRDPNLAHEPDAQNALKEIVKLKSVSDLHSMEAKVVADFKEIIQKDQQSTKAELANLSEESERTKERQTELKHKLEIIEKALERMNPNPLRYAGYNLLNTTILVLGDVFWNLSGNVKGVKKKQVVSWLMLLLFFRCYLLLDDSSLKDGCTMPVYDDPWKLKFFDFTDFINSSRAEFIGRQWLYQEMESVLEGTDKRGVLITGNPGSGKSAFLSHLLCSKTSSPVVHSRILAHHFCMHFHKKTLDGATFVRNLANMIAWKLGEYRQRILSDSFVRRALYQECSQDPEWCFELAIVRPLKQFQPQPKAPWYIVVDALDECFSDKADVVNILKSKARRLPKWLKLIVSSRNMSSIVTGLEGFHRLQLLSDSKENLEDIDTYLTLKVFSLKDSMVERFKTCFSIQDNDAPTQVLVSNLAKKGHGNFLYVKVMLDLWLTSAEQIDLDWETFPKSLESTYQLYFEKKFSTLESFRSLREIFEVLVAAYTPLTIREMHYLFSLENPALDLEYDFMPKLEQVSIFLWHGSEGDLRVHHASLSEWLTSDTNKGKVYYVKKQNGHNRLAKYYLKAAAKSMLQPYEAFHLASHVVEGGLDNVLVKQFLSLPSGNINTTENLSQTTALHFSSSSRNTNVTKLLLQHFFNVDCLDNNERTPSFIAATAGQVGNLLVLFNRGANLYRTTAYLDAETASHSVDPVKECKRRKCGYSLLHTAAQEGNLDVVKFLLQKKVSISKTSGSNNTAIQLAAENGHRDTVVMLRKAGGIPDGLSLHHSASNGHTLVVTYLLKEGVKDTCFEGTPRLLSVNVNDEELNSTKKYVHDSSHLHSRETALHAAVRREHLSVIEILLREDQNAVNCKNSAGRNPQHEAVYLNKYNSLKALLESGASASIPCGFETSSPLLHHETLVPETPQEDGCPCGFTPLHLAGKYGHHSVAELLVKYGADINMGDCNGSTPLHIASCHGMSSILFLLVEKEADINAKSLNGSTPLHSAAACFAKGALRPLFELGCDHLATDNEGMSALHYSVKDANVSGFGYFADWYVNNPKDWIEKAASAPNQIMDTMNKINLQYPWMDSLVELIKTSITKDVSMSLLEIEDSRNETFFDKLEGKTKASSTLLGTNTGSGFSFVLSLNPLVFALDVIFSEAIIKRVTSPLNEPSLTPKPFERVITKTLTSIFTKLDCSDLVSAVGDRMVHVVNAMLKAGLNVDCYDSKSGLTPLLVYLRTGGRHISKVLVKHNVKMEIICGDPFEMSALHLASYHKLHYLHYIYQFFMGANKWDRYLKTDNAIFDYFLDIYEERNNSQGIQETLRIGDGPLTTAILSHPSGTKVIDECFDEEGFNALHRAAQGANVVAIRKFISWGANHSLESENGFTPLWLSVLHAVKYRAYLNFERVSVLTSLEVEMASLTASEILDHSLKNEIFDVGCNESRSDLTLYHVAAIQGMWQFIAHLLSSKRVRGINVNCPNNHGITPMYLAKFMGGDSCEGYSSWCKVVDVIKSFGGTLQYPTLEAEYFLITNVFFGKSPSPLSVELSDDEIMSLREKCGQEKCRQYKTSNGDLFRTCDEVDKVHNDYQMKVEKCSRLRQECPFKIRTTELRHVTFVVYELGESLSHKFSFFDIRNDFINFLDREIERLKDLLNTVTRPHEEMQCVKSKQSESSERIAVADDMCFNLNKVNLETAVHNLYRNYKRSLDVLNELSDDVKSIMPLQGRLPRVLRKMNIALHSYDSTLNCDWQAIAAKYIQLSFQVRNLNFWRQSVHETSTVPSVSDFVAERMQNVILEASEESRQLVLKLTSKEPFQEFSYLQILQIQKPPFWHETFDGRGNFR